MKKCPYCLAELHEATIVCPYCDSDLMVTVPIRVVARQKDEEKSNRRSRLIARLVVGVSIVLIVTSLAVLLVWLWNPY